MTTTTFSPPRPGPLTPPTPRSPHPDWCTRGHPCNLGEHRAHPIRIDVPQVGSLIVTRVQGTAGHQYAEVRASLQLTPHEPHARHQLATVLDGLTHLMWTARRTA